MWLNHRERFQLVRPPEYDRFFVDFPQVHFDAGFQFGLGRDAYSGLGHLAEEEFDQVQPRTMGGREDEFETVGYGGQKGPSLPGNMRGVMVKDRGEGGPPPDNGRPPAAEIR